VEVKDKLEENLKIFFERQLNVASTKDLWLHTLAYTSSADDIFEPANHHACKRQHQKRLNPH